MLERIGRMADAAIGLAQARAGLIVRDVEAVGVALAGYVCAGALVALGALCLMAALATALARPLGWAGALGVVGGLMLVIGLAVLATLRSRSEAEARARQDLEAEAQRNVEVLKAAGGPDPQKGGHAPGHAPANAPAPGIRGALLQTLTSNPALVASSAFAVLSVLGPRRSLRMLGTAASGAGIAASLLKTLRAVHESAGSNGHIPREPASDSRASNRM